MADNDVPVLPPLADDGADEKARDLQDVVSSIYFGYGSYSGISTSQKEQIREWMRQFYAVAGNSANIAKQIQDGKFDPDSLQAKVLDRIIDNPEILDEFVKDYTMVLDLGGGDYYEEFKATADAEHGGNLLANLIGIYRDYKTKTAVTTAAPDPFDYITSQLNLMSVSGPIVGHGDNAHPSTTPRFVPVFDHLDTNKVIRDMLLRDGGKFREDTLPASISRLQCRIGASTFFVPPTSISVHQAFKAGSLTNGVLRQPNSPKMNLGHSDTEINLTLYFPNHETIWGFSGNSADFDIFNWDPQPEVRKDREKVSGQTEIPKATVVPDSVIDRYLSSLRGLVTQFKYSPFLPVKNEYLNRTYDITAVTMSGLTVSTVPDFPFVLAVNLQMKKFNFKPFLPMIDDFDSAIHWGKFRQYMGRAAARLDAKVNQGFLVESPNRDADGSPGDDTSNGTVFEGDLLPKFNKVSDIQTGKNFEFYYPITTPGRIFAPDTTDFRQPGEDDVVTQDIWDFVLSSIGLDLIDPPQFDFFEYDRVFRASKFRNERRVLFEWLAANKIAWQLMSTENMNRFIEEQILIGERSGDVTNDNREAVRQSYRDNWFEVVYALVIEDNNGLKQLKDSRNFQNSHYSIKEWKVPMEHLLVDWSNCIVNNVSVSLSNNFAMHQVQLQDEPTYQHIGGGDSRIDVSMTIIGEDNLTRFRRLFEHINGLARLEKVHGVLGFLGIKNVITSLCGIKYVLPLDFEVSTIPNFPHVYNVAMSFIDFDIMQQEREQLSSKQQKSLVDAFGKRNPFLRLKQNWSMFNAYPDFPLDLRDEDGSVLAHLDADWYFRSFVTSQSDDKIFNWGFNDKVINLVRNIAELSIALDTKDGNTLDSESRREFSTRMAQYEEQLRVLVEEQGENLPTNSGWSVVDGLLVAGDKGAGGGTTNDLPEPEMVQHLGFYDSAQIKSSVIGFFEGGYFSLGTQDLTTGDYKWDVGMKAFKEDLASNNLKYQQGVAGTVPIYKYQNEYLDNATNPNKQYEAIMRDYNYRNLRGRMIRAFPTYMLWLIDEGGQFGGVKLFDNFYGLNSVIDYSVVMSEDPTGDTLVLRLSNIYNKLTTPFKDQIVTEDDPLYDTVTGQWITTIENRQRNIESGLTNEIVEIDSIRLKPGVRIHLRMGYGANPNSLQTVFNGVIAEVEAGDIVTVIAQSDAVEFTGMVNTVNQKGSSGNIDGGITGFWLSEPRDLMVRLLTMGSSNFKEWLAWGSKGVLFSDSRFGIRHFGTILYEPMSDKEVTGTGNVQRAIGASFNNKNASSANSFQGLLGDYATDLTKITSITSLPSALNGNLVKIGTMLWLNQAAKRDYEIYKRNIYPGNGSGIAQFMGGDQIDAGITISTATAWYNSSNTTDQITEEHTSHASPHYSSPTDTEEAIAAAAAVDATNQKTQRDAIESLWVTYEQNNGSQTSAGNADPLTDDEITTIMQGYNKSRVDTIINTPTVTEGLLSSILGLAGQSFDFGMGLFDDVDDALTEAFGGGIKGELGSGAIELFVGGPIGLFAGKYGGLASGTARLAKGLFTGQGDYGLGHILGLNSGIEDDDLEGFDEVSFRAQTYMKTVWDLFQLCAALLPNYIVAVRPFEDRSTVFYGKPHWLYTSGVIPVSAGVPKDVTAKPGLEEADSVRAKIIEQAKNSTSGELERMMQVIDQSGTLKDIMHFNGENVDPYAAGGDKAHLSTKEQADEIAKALGTIENEAAKNALLQELKSFDTTQLSYDQLKELFIDFPYKELTPGAADSQFGLDDLVPDVPFIGGDPIDIVVDVFSDSDPQFPVRAAYDSEADWITAIKKIYDKKIADYQQSVLDNISSNSDSEYEKALRKRQFFTGPGADAFTSNGTGSQAELDAAFEVYKKDPITFAYNFGWKFQSIPVWFDPASGFGTDQVGSMARALYDEDADPTVKAITSDRSFGEASSIWSQFRANFRNIKEVKSLYDQYFPTNTNDYDAVMDLFLRFLWQDPYNRAWIVVTADKVGDGLVDTVVNTATSIFSDEEDQWSFGKAKSAWEVFLSSGDTEVNEDSNIIISPSTRRFMEGNAKPGDDARGLVQNIIEDAAGWVDDNVGQLLGLISDTITGFISSIRMSLMQMGNAVSQAGDMQRQANILNASLNDSIYYQMGDEGSILRLVDNPFTREYGEPVIEIREPFQRIHYVSSFDSILDNKISENLNDVATVITAVSDGKYPVTVHFDKGISPERQIEKVVETGLYWDNAVGSGLFGFLQPLLHPLETLRGLDKSVTGSSDQLSSRRVALYHLKEGLKNIYTGEIVIIGNADIRPHDLLYIADVYERMYGMVEVEQVIHHFTPDTGFVTAITPNAIVTINDPARWTLLSYMWSKMTTYNMRDDMRAFMNVKADRTLAQASQEIDSSDIYKYFSTQMNGAVQHTQGSTALIRDIGAVYTGGGIKGLRAKDDAVDEAAKIDLVLGAAKTVAPIVGGIIGAAAGPEGAIVGGAALWGVTDLLWQGWQWVKENLLDQHGCYIQYLNKDGMPMDAGLSYASGVAVGTNHTVNLFPGAMGIQTRFNTKEDGHYRITINDILGSLGYSEVETVSLYRDTSMFVNNINTQILALAGRDPVYTPTNNYMYASVRVLEIDDKNANNSGIEDGDTINVRVVAAGNSTYAVGSILKLRLSKVNTYELEYHDDDYTQYNETDFNPKNDMGKLAYDYLTARFSTAASKNIAIRVDKRNEKSYDRIVADIFHNVPLGTEDRSATLLQYASREPPIPFDSYLNDGRPYTLNWEMVMTGYGQVDMRESLWNTSWRNDALTQNVSEGGF